MKDPREGAEEGRFPQSGNAFQKNVAARQQTDQDAVHDILLANDDLSNFLANFFELPAGLNYPLIGGHNFILVQASV
jgi:hypothetical protein